MSVMRTTVMLEEKLYDRVLDHLKANGKEETVQEFTQRAFINQLENDGDFSIRDEMEELENAKSNKNS